MAFGLHLRTIIVAGLVCVLVFRANMASYPYTFYESNFFGMGGMTIHRIGNGWPCNMGPKSVTILSLPDYGAILINLGVALCILGAAGFLCEWYLRHSEKKAMAKDRQTSAKAP